MKIVILNKNFDKIDLTVYLLIAVGIFLRVWHYLGNRSLWLDEAWVAVDVTARSFYQIFFNIPFDSDLPIPPVGFLLMEKLSIEIFGNNEYSLRLFPLLCGIASLFLFYRLLKKYTCKSIWIPAMAFFVFSEGLIYYSAEVKQYGWDVLFAIILYLLVDRFKQDRLDKKNIYLLGFVGICALFFSHASVFVLASVGLMQVVVLLAGKNKDLMPKILHVFFIWLMGFILFYFCYFQYMTKHPQLMQDADFSFLPLPIFTKKSMVWGYEHFAAILKETMGLYPQLAIGFFVYGVFNFWRLNKLICIMFFSSLIFVLIASALHKYPFYHRFVLFFLPVMSIFIAQGIDGFSAIFKKNKLVIKIILMVVLLFYPVKLSLEGLFHRHKREDLRPVMLYLKNNIQKGDRVLVNDFSRSAFTYYHIYYGLKDEIPFFGVVSDFSKILVNREHIVFLEGKLKFDADGNFYKKIRSSDMVWIDLYSDILIPPAGRRCWYVLSHSKSSSEDLRKYFDVKAKKVKEFISVGASVRLYQGK